MKIITKSGTKFVCVLSYFFTLVLLVGCWDRTELNDLAIVLAAGIDKSEENGITLTLQFANPEQMGGQQGMGGGSGNGQKTITKQAEGETIFEAASFLQEQFSREIFWGHIQALIIGKDLAENGIQPYVDFFNHHPDPRLRSHVYVASGKAEEVLKVQPLLEPSSGDIARELSKLKIGMSVTLKELMQMLSSEAGGAALPTVRIVPHENGKGTLQLTGTAIFKDAQMIGSIDDRLTRGLLWIRDEIHLAAVKLSPEQTEGFLSFNLIRSNTQLEPKIVNGQWKIIINITSVDDIVENQTNLQVTDPKIIKELEESLGNKVEERIRMVLNDVQREMKTDIFGFADAFHRKYPDEWAEVKADWDEKFPEVEVDINSNVYIKRLGMSISPQGMPEKEVKKTE